MASVNERLTRLERRTAPRPYKPNPWTGLVFKTTAHARAELDGEEPGPLVLTHEEKRLELASAEHFLVYLEEQRALRPSADNLRALDEYERMTRKHMEMLKAEIERQEGDDA